MNARKIVDILLEDEDFDMEDYALAALTPEEAYTMACTNPELRPKLERVIATDAGYSYSYARHVLKGQFPAGEPALATDAYRAYDYAVFTGNRFPLAEPEIAKYIQLKQMYQHTFGVKL